VRGEIYELRNPRDTREHEQRGNRYAVVVQSSDLMTSTWIVCPTSTSAAPAFYRPEIEIAGKTTRVLVEQVCAVDPTRLGSRVGYAGRAEMKDIDQALLVVLDLLD
jgi:mRNA interferase MazF